MNGISESKMIVFLKYNGNIIKTMFDSLGSNVPFNKVLLKYH